MVNFMCLLGQAGPQLFSQTRVQMLSWTTFVAMYFVNVINIYNQVTLSKTDTLHNMDTPDPISEGLKSKN